MSVPLNEICKVTVKLEQSDHDHHNYLTSYSEIYYDGVNCHQRRARDSETSSHHQPKSLSEGITPDVAAYEYYPTSNAIHSAWNTHGTSGTCKYASLLFISWHV